MSQNRVVQAHSCLPGVEWSGEKFSHSRKWTLLATYAACNFPNSNPIRNRISEKHRVQSFVKNVITYKLTEEFITAAATMFQTLSSNIRLSDKVGEKIHPYLKFRLQEPLLIVFLLGNLYFRLGTFAWRSTFAQAQNAHSYLNEFAHTLIYHWTALWKKKTSPQVGGTSLIVGLLSLVGGCCDSSFPCASLCRFVFFFYRRKATVFNWLCDRRRVFTRATEKKRMRKREIGVRSDHSGDLCWLFFSYRRGFR